MDQRIIAQRLCPIVYEDDHYLFVNKPAGLASQPHPRRAGAAVTAILADREDAARLLPVYDISPWQSGVLGYAKTEAARHHLLVGLESGSAKPAFIAVIQGKLKPGLQRMAGALKQVGKDRFALDRHAAATAVPVTEFEPLERGTTRALVNCRPGVLNHHQVRAHLAALHLRIVGDAAYSGRDGKPQAGPVLLHLGELRFHHPGLKRAVTIRAKPPADFAAALDRPTARPALDGMLTARLRAALAARLPYLLDDETNAFRVLNGPADEVPGLAAELLDDVLILQVQQGKFDAAKAPLRELAQWYHRQLGVRAVYAKHFVKDRSRAGVGEELADPEPLAGEPAPEHFVVRENGLQFVVRPYDGYAFGLFLDQRENRRRVRELAADRNVLNLFSYTCGFSVAAAAGGAQSTVSVDLARKSLEWGKENFAANGLALDAHLFIKDDAFNYFKRAARQRRTFDLVLIDPPSFARVKQGRRVFTVEKDLQLLVAGAVELLAPGGVLLVSTNARGASTKWLREQIHLAAGARRMTVMATPPLPLDFAGDPDHAKTIIVRLA
jgi:23S rRNA (cytosine1962-C5)-methyltransferase